MNLPQRLTFLRHPHFAMCVVFLGLTLCTINPPRACADDDEGKVEKFVLSPTFSVLSVAPAPNGKQAAIAVGDMTLRIWDLEKGEELIQWQAHQHPSIHRVVYEPDGKYVLSCCEDGSVIQWEAATGKEIRQFKGHPVGVSSIEISADGKRLLSSGADAAMRLFYSAGSIRIRFRYVPAA